ncbi:MAG: hypothetical protein ABI615_11305 [Chthoniobacterales bacterium]
MSDTPKKPRSDSKLLTLPEDQQEKIYEWCKEKACGYSGAVENCWQDLGVRTPFNQAG